MNRTARLLVFCTLVTGFSGCNPEPSDRPELGVVTGIVKLDGHPLKGASVMYLPDEGRASSGFTDDTGTYTLSYTDTVPGAKLGHHTVQITTAAVDEPAKEKLPARYHTESILTADVQPGKNEIHFDLESK